MKDEVMWKLGFFEKNLGGGCLCYEIYYLPKEKSTLHICVGKMHGPKLVFVSILSIYFETLQNNVAI